MFTIVRQKNSLDSEEKSYNNFDIVKAASASNIWESVSKTHIFKLSHNIKPLCKERKLSNSDLVHSLKQPGSEVKKEGN